MDGPPSLQRCCTALLHRTLGGKVCSVDCKYPTLQFHVPALSRCTQAAHRRHGTVHARCKTVQSSTTRYNSIYAEHIYRCTFTCVRLHVYIYRCTLTDVHLHSVPSGSPIPVVSLRGQAERSPLLTDTTLRSTRSRGPSIIHPSEGCGGRQGSKGRRAILPITASRDVPFLPGLG